MNGKLFFHKSAESREAHTAYCTQGTQCTFVQRKPKSDILSGNGHIPMAQPGPQGPSPLPGLVLRPTPTPGRPEYLSHKRAPVWDPIRLHTSPGQGLPSSLLFQSREDVANWFQTFVSARGILLLIRPREPCSTPGATATGWPKALPLGNFIAPPNGGPGSHPLQGTPLSTFYPACFNAGRTERPVSRGGRLLDPRNSISASGATLVGLGEGEAFSKGTRGQTLSRSAQLHP